MLSKNIKLFIKIINTYIPIILCLAIGTISAHKIHKKQILRNKVIYQLCQCDFCDEIRQTSLIKTYKTIFSKKVHCNKKLTKNGKSNRTLMVYMAADNDLRPFAARNIQQMANIGSNQNITIVVHLDIRISGNQKITRRYFIEKNQVIHVDQHDILTQQMDSGNPSTLISFCEWAIKNYPANEYDLILWNHGTGILEPPHGKIINPMDLFVFNPSTHRLDLDRSIEFMDAIDHLTPQQRGVCWDDTTGNYLSNRKLEIALQTICKNCLGGKKFGLIGFDACLMSMLEVSSYIKKYSEIMIGSEEVELGMGWKYDEVLYPFTKTPLDTSTFARHIIAAYDKTYQTITNDYTLAAINLDSIELLEKNVDYVSKLLIECLEKHRTSILSIIKESKNKLLCTHFDEPTYIDLHHFYKNLLNNLRKLATENTQISPMLKNTLIMKLDEGIRLIEHLVIANVAGKNLKNAQGIAIYFPERSIHNSYKESIFITANAWGSFLSRYVFG
ncbi:MAG TPA: clostripain-related cysteine peptidase [Candidatus Babeliales bacterium]|nr:clostripain-related cysteine peptidase [Candidatus Babeliales bacterium]